MFTAPPDPDEFKRMGIPMEALAPQDPPPRPWPCNRVAFNMFYDLSSQWRSNMGGYYALDYNCAYQWMDAEGIEGKRRNKLIRQLGYIANGALEAMREAMERKRGQKAA